ncbi:hypothetical protein [Pontibacter akesuensis]|uniref:Dolichyl-phosphate-mannose-protein mannosyltransferase n=1 Tax=Pontibacter akesuensis TaxID=388950 RepID=A0A1I7J371_9BACT|nr:hypothetical protein [Pontibacter akesuensis]SFU79604.1 hypothetical protein SAMN04487941_2451 [Pontibacter akesuensis]
MLLVYLLNLLVLGTLVWRMWRQPWAQELRPYFVPALGLKLLLVVALTYLYYAGILRGDRHTYHLAGIKLWEYAQQEPLAYMRLLFFNSFENEALRNALPFTQYPDYSNSFYFIKVVSVLNLLTGGSYLLNNLYLTIYGFWGSAYLVAVLARLFPKYRAAGAVAFLFFPTVLYWSVGLMKDPVMYGSMCWLTGAAVSLAHGFRFRRWQLLLLPLQLYILLKIKMFYAALLLPLLLVYVLVQRLQVRFTSLQTLRAQVICYGAVVAGALVLTALVFREKLLVDYVPQFIYESYTGILPRAQHRPHVLLEGFEPSIKSLLLHYPEAALSAVYRPFLGESWDILFVLSSLENLLLLGLTLLALAAAFRKGAHLDITLLQVVLLVFVLVMAGVVGLATPNFGTLSRYRLVFLPFLVYLLLQNVYAQRLLYWLRLR